MPSIKFYYWWGKFRLAVQKYILRINTGRQPYQIATIPLNEYIPDVIFYNLLRKHFQPNYFAYSDQGELYSLRRLVITTEDEIWQEHVRIFQDEMRVHYEISYEEDAEKHANGSTLTEVSDLTKAEILATIPGLNK